MTKALRDYLGAPADCVGRQLCGAHGSVALSDVLSGTCLGGRLSELSGRSVLLRTRDQLSAALAMLELDGVVRRMVICPPDLAAEHLPGLIGKAEVDAIVSDSDLQDAGDLGVRLHVRASAALAPCLNSGWHGLPARSRQQPAAEAIGESADRQPAAEAVATEQLGGLVARRDRPVVCSTPTEWVLLTSGTSGVPKMLAHTLAALTGAIKSGQHDGSDVVWGTFYDIRRYGGLQIFLRAMLGRRSLVLSDAGETPKDFLMRLGAQAVTHLTGTPSHWRRALMSPAARAIAPRYVRLSGEIADQAILNTLRSFFPAAAVGHAFASTEAGVSFEVNDGLEGFPVSVIGRNGDVEIKVADGSLRIRSSRAAGRYVGEETVLVDAEGFVDTGDMVELRGGETQTQRPSSPQPSPPLSGGEGVQQRYYFLGRRSGVINVGGLKVYPEEVEALINRHPAVHMSWVRSKRNPITGALVVADVVLKDAENAANGKAKIIEQEILKICRDALPRHKVPAALRFVPALGVAESGKMGRPNA